MRKRLLLAFVLFSISALSFFGFRFFQTKINAPAALQVTATPKSEVFLNGELLGTTPFFNDKLKPGEHTIKIVPEGAKATFEQKVKLSRLLLTAIDQTFRETDSLSEGSILTLEPIGNKGEAEVFVLSTPSDSKVLFDSQLRGVTPLEIKDVTISDHEIELDKEGFLKKEIRVKTSPGYKLIANVKLAISLEEEKTATETATPSATPTPTSPPSVKIKQTPTGFLRVRFSPTLSASEVARVRPGETFPILEEQTAWTKIFLPDGKQGWVSNQYITTP